MKTVARPALNTRQQILDLLKRAGTGLTADALAHKLGITAVAVRKHLAALERDSLVAAELERRPMGRPTFRYRPTAAADELFPNDYPTLATTLLELIRRMDGEHKVDELFRLRAKVLAEELTARVKGKTLQERLHQVAQILEEQGYMPEILKLEKGKDHYLLTEHHCPIFQVAKAFKQACTCELDILFKLLQAKVERRDHRMIGHANCSYLISGS
ncbi:MAG: HTH domain-containing protein [Nitrospinae bacterium]|nr:HTH domain-containing protein [Nitrospinota bacterium]